MWFGKTKHNWHWCFSGSPDLHAAQRGQHLSPVIKVPLRQRLPVPTNKCGGSPNKAECNTTLLRSLLPRFVLRSGRRTAASSARRYDNHSRQTSPRAATAASSASSPVPAAEPRQPGFPLPGGSQHSPPAASPRTSAFTSQFSGEGGRFRIRWYAFQRVEAPVSTVVGTSRFREWFCSSGVPRVSPPRLKWQKYKHFPSDKLQ